MISQEIIDQILDRIDIVEIITEYIPLKRAGRNFKAQCPFHNEKTPSFVVSPEKQIYHCFGCGAGGNVIGFIMNYDNLDFPGTIELLAKKLGIILPNFEKRSSKNEDQNQSLYRINDIAAAFYQNTLLSEKGKNAYEYLKKRGLDKKTITTFRIGYAPDEWEAFGKYCVSKKISGQLLQKAGLTIQSEKGKNDYDRFRNRIIFPIIDEKDRIVAFGGRVMDNSLPKYINSPETSIYSKSNILYGLNLSRLGIKDSKHVIISEGYLDVIIPFQYGIKNIVATSGTALTNRQVSMMKRYTDTAVMVFDSDHAGKAASLRGLDILIEYDMNVRIVTLPEGDDPDSFVRNNGAQNFIEIVKEAKGLFEYKLDILTEQFGLKDVGKIVNEMLPTIAKLKNTVVQSSYLTKLAEKLRIHESSLRFEMGKVKPDYSYRYDANVKMTSFQEPYKNSELHLLGLAMLDKKLFDRICSEFGLNNFFDNTIKKIMDVIDSLYHTNIGTINPGKLLSRFENDEPAKKAVIHAITKTEITIDSDIALTDCILSAQKENRENELKNLTTQLKKAQQDNNDIAIKRLVSRINQLHKEKVL